MTQTFEAPPQFNFQNPTKTQVRLPLYAAALLAVTVSPLCAQLVADGTTNTLSNISTNITGDVIVGTNGSFTLLVLADNSLLTNSVNGIIGCNTTAKSNEVRLISSTAAWRMGGSLFVGSNGAFNSLIVSNGGLLLNSNAHIGFTSGSTSNVALLSGAGTIWNNPGTLFLGESGGGNRLVVGEGARIESPFATVGAFASASNNEAVVSGPGSFWKIEQSLQLGNFGNGNRLVISNSARVFTSGTFMGSSNNEVLVTGPGSAWTNLGTLRVGGIACRLVVSNGAEVVDSFDITVGVGSTNNRIVVDGGTVRAVNSGSGLLEVRRGTNVLNAGLIEVDRLRLTNAQGFFEFNGGTLSIKNSTVSNGVPFLVGNGVSPATLILAGNGLHQLPSLLLNVVSSNATLTGNGTISGLVQSAAGSRLIPGLSVGKIVFSNSPSLQGATLMEISKNGATLTNDQIQVTAALTYGGTLTVGDLGPTALAIGDRFPLFNANSYAGAFSAISLPPLSAGLNWTNKLLVDGSIEVIAGPKFTSVILSGTNVTFAGTGSTPGANYAVLTATNVITPLSNWLSIATNQFSPAGTFSFTNSIIPGELQRYFRIRTP